MLSFSGILKTTSKAVNQASTTMKTAKCVTQVTVCHLYKSNFSLSWMLTLWAQILNHGKLKAWIVVQE